MAKIKIGIVLEGGVIQAIVSNGPVDADVFVIDYDTDCADEADLTAVPQTNGEDDAMAYVSDWGKPDHGDPLDMDEIAKRCAAR